MLAHHQYQQARARVNSALDNAYERLAETSDYKRNENNLRLIQLAVVTVSAIATGFVNAFAHAERIGYPLACLLALLVTGFVEKFYFTLRHGLTTTYKAGKQRLYASLSYRTIQITMVLNAAVLTAWIVGVEVPSWLMLWNHWSIACHFGLALIGVAAVRDADAVVENRMLELKAETARQDLVTARKAAAIGNPLVLLAAKTRGLVDACALAVRLLFRGGGFARDYADQIESVARTQYAHLDRIGPGQGQNISSTVANFPGNSGLPALPKGPAPRP